MIIYYSTNISDSTIKLTDDDHRHCSKVTRRSIGDEVYVTDGKGGLYTCQIDKISRNETELKILNTDIQDKPKCQLAIAIAPTKNNSRLEWFLEKATEIGISDIYPILCTRGEKPRLKAERLQKIIISAVKQSKNLHTPILHPLNTVSELLKALPQYDLKAVAHCLDVEQHLSKYIDKEYPRILVAIGPEGDFTESELELFNEHHFVEINLGKSRLRTETAGVVAASIVNDRFLSL